MNKLTNQEKIRLTKEIRKFIDEITPSGFYESDMPRFVKGRKDVCVVIKHLEDKSKDLIFLVWVKEDGIHSMSLNKWNLESNLELEEAFEKKGKIIVKISNSGCGMVTIEILPEKMGLKPRS
jgi:hypothetical protein